MALGELNLYNYSGGMPALSGSPEANGKVNGTALRKAEKANGVPYKVAGLSRDLVQVRMPDYLGGNELQKDCVRAWLAAEAFCTSHPIGQEQAAIE